MQITFDDKKLRRFERDLKTFAAQAVPFANRATLNDAVFMARKVAQNELGQRMILRNKWTASSVRVQRATQKRVRDQHAVVGAVDQYLEQQEFGATRRPEGKHGVPIPTRSASGEGRGSAPRSRPVRPPKTRRRIKLRRRVRGARGRAQGNVVAVRQAAGSGRKFVALRTRRGVGIFKIEGGRTKPRVEMIWDLSRQTVRTPANPWLKPSVDVVAGRMPGIYRKNLKKQLLRRRIFAR